MTVVEIAEVLKLVGFSVPESFTKEAQEKLALLGEQLRKEYADRLLELYKPHDTSEVRAFEKAIQESIKETWGIS